jgi:hypothetical protein
MTDISDARKNILVEETQFKSAVSEAVIQKVGASINFINNRQYDSHSWNFNGNYSLGVGVVGADGIFPVLFDMEIVGLTMFNRVSGLSGTTELDVEWLNGSNSNQGSIFSTTPKLTFSSSNYSYIIRDELNSTNVELPTGATAPVFSKTQFDAGDALFCEIVSSMSGGADLSLLLHFRPR